MIVDCSEAGVWAFHCHILSHAEGDHGMYGMVTALIVTDAAAAEAVPDQDRATFVASPQGDGFVCKLS